MFTTKGEIMSQETFDEKYMKTILEMIQYLKDTKLLDIGLTINDDHEEGKEWNFKLTEIQDKFSEEHPYCKKECYQCQGGAHSDCDDTEKCHNTDEECYWVDLD